MTDRPLTVFQQCMNELLRRIREMPADENDPSQGSFWNGVEFGSITDRDNTTFPVIGVYEGTEEVVDNLFPLVQKNVQLYLEFRFSPTEVDVYDDYRYYIGRLQRALLREDGRNLGGLCNNLAEVGNNPEIEGKADPAPGGVLMLTIQYEHVNGNPYKGRKDLQDGNYQ